MINYSDLLGCTWNCVHFYEVENFKKIENKINEKIIKKYWMDAPYTAGKLVSFWQTAAERNSHEKIPFHLIFVL